MKTTAYLLGLAAVIALLALNLVESIRIRKALCGEYPIYHRSVLLEEGAAYEDTVKNMAKEEGMERQGWRYVGQSKNGAHTHLDFVRIERTGRVLTATEAEELEKFRLKAK